MESDALNASLERMVPGLEGTRSLTVTEAQTAHAFGNTGVYVFSSPHLANELELACVEAVRALLPDGITTVPAPSEHGISGKDWRGL